MDAALQPISYGLRLSQLAAEHPDRTAITFVPREGDEQRTTWRELDRRSNQISRMLAERGVDQQATVVIALGNRPEHFLVTYAAWKLGAMVLPLRVQLPEHERDAILDVAKPRIIVADWEGLRFPGLSRADLEWAADSLDDPLPDRIPNPGRATASGGSTGRPKLIVSTGPLTSSPGALSQFWSPLGFATGQTQLVAAPLYHAMPLFTSICGLFEGHSLVLMERFDPSRLIDLVERHRVNWIYLAPIMMKRIAAVPGIEQRDLSSLHAIASTAAPVPPWLKRRWIDLIGPERITEAYLMSEGVGCTMIRGDEWLVHPGSVGKPHLSEVRILNEAGGELSRGEVGEIFLRFDPELMPPPRYMYLGAPPATVTDDQFTCVGDMGWLDEDGYLYIAERRVDMIVTGGANVFAAEVEAALSEHREVADVAVVGVPDEEWGRRVHAIIQPRDVSMPPSISELNLLCRERLSAYKVPKTYEFVAELPRNDAGKIRRSALVEERAAGWTSAMILATP